MAQQQQSGGEFASRDNGLVGRTWQSRRYTGGSYLQSRVCAWVSEDLVMGGISD